MNQLQKNVFIGRKLFIKEFYTTLTQIQEDQGQILSVEGPVGIGCSTLLNRYNSILEQKNAKYISCQLSPESHDPLHCFKDWSIQLLNFDSPAGIALGETEKNILLALNNPKILRSLPYEGKEFELAVAYTFRKIVKYFNSDHIVFVIEDLHFAPEETIRYLKLVFEDFENDKILFLYTMTSRDNLPWKKDLNYNEHKLPHFTYDEVYDFCNQHLDVDHISQSVVEALNQSSKGNPLYLEKLIEHALNQNYMQYIEEDGKRSIILKKNIGSIPQDLSQLLLARFFTLTKDEQEILHHTCLFGYEDNADLLKAYLDSHFQKDVHHEFKVLFEEHFLDVTSNFPQHKYRFNHALLYETLLKEIKLETRVHIHTLIAQFLDQNSNKFDLGDLTYKIAHHAQKSSDTALIIKYCFSAGVKSYKNNQFQLCTEYFSQLENHLEKLGKEELEQYVILNCTALIATESLVYATSFINKFRKKIQFTKPIFDFLEAEIAHYQNQYQQVIDKSKSFDISDTWSNSFFSELLPMRLKSLLNNGNIDTVIHESFVTLRKLMLKDNNAELQANIWGKVLLATQYSRRTSVAPNIIAALNQYPLSSFSVKTRIDLNNNINRWHVSSQKYDKAIYNFSQSIQMCEKNFLINTKNELAFYQGIVYTMLGNFSLAMSRFRFASEELFKLNNIRQSYNAFMYLVDCLLDQGSMKSAEHELKKFSNYKQLNKSDINLAMENINFATYYFYKKNYLLAESHFYKSAHHYKKANFMRASYKQTLRSLILKTYIEQKNEEEILNLYRELNKKIQKNTLDDEVISYLNIAYFMIKSVGIDINLPCEVIEVEKITDIYTKQWFYIAKITYLKSKKNSPKLKELITEYQKIRNNILVNVPKQFKKDFINHPIFKVPSLD